MKKTTSRNMNQNKASLQSQSILLVYNVATLSRPHNNAFVPAPASSDCFPVKRRPKNRKIKQKKCTRPTRPAFGESICQFAERISSC